MNVYGRWDWGKDRDWLLQMQLGGHCGRDKGVRVWPLHYSPVEGKGAEEAMVSGKLVPCPPASRQNPVASAEVPLTA